MTYSLKKTVYTTKQEQEQASRIEKVDHADGVVLLSGTQNGRGWSLSLTEATGYLVLTVAGDQVAFVVFGACTPHNDHEVFPCNLYLPS